MEVGNQTKVTRDDWISRFFGYLGSLEYIYKKNETTSPREWNADSVGDNIVYIYGVPKGGKTHYRKQLSLEFKEALRQTKFGKSMTESLNDMQKRIPSDSINNIILALTQANIYGSSIISTMYNQIDYFYSLCTSDFTDGGY